MDKNKLNFITEIASSHNGSLRLLENLTNKHLLSSSNYIKFQIFKTLNLYKKNTKTYKRYKKIEIDYQKWDKLIKNYYPKTKIILEPFDEESYNFCTNYSKYLDIKISSSESDNFELVIDANRRFSRVFINLSGYNQSKINYLLSNYKFNKKKSVLMYGFQSYPTNINDLNFNNFEKFRENGFISGYADHTHYNSYFNLISSSILSILKNAKFIEKHVCENRNKKPPDYITSLEFPEYELFIDTIKIFYSLINKKNYKYSQKEKIYSNTMHKFAISNKVINLNEKIKKSDLIFLRTNLIDGINRLDLEKNDYKTRKKILKNEFIYKQKIKKI